MTTRRTSVGHVGRASDGEQFNRLTAPFEVRVWSRVEKGDGCWLWRGGVTSKGYGNLNVPGTEKKIAAHRATWELTNGPIPDGLLVLHRCDNPPCVNPAHLFLGTHRDNARDMRSKGRGRNGHGRHGVGMSCRRCGGPRDVVWSSGRRRCRPCLRVWQHVAYQRRLERRAAARG